MKIVLKVIAVVVGLLVGVVGLEIIASESGEVVVLETQDDQGVTVETRLWVIDYQGSAWLRSGSNTAGWYQRLLSQDAVRVTRAGEVMTVRPQPSPESLGSINGLMAEKYGWADTYIGMLFGRDDSIPIRLELVE